jgi:glycosyltransferase involved in cell wall biosynthesis
MLTPAPKNILPSQRFRFEQYIDLTDKPPLEFSLSPFFNLKAWSYLHKKGHLFEKVKSVTTGFLKRIGVLFLLHQYQFVYIHREAASIGPPVFEWLIAKVFKKKIIYDLDDAIWISTASAANPGINLIKCAWKVRYICKWSYIVTTGNQFLADYASQFSNDVRIIPTVVNTESVHNQLKNQYSAPLTIGWTGTYTNFSQLDIIIPVLARLQAKYMFKFLIIADKDPLLREIPYEFKCWNVITEIEDLLQMHIGVMPLHTTTIELGKCALKAIQYMSLGIPPVVSDVGANKTIVIDGECGYWASNAEEWYKHLETLLLNTPTRIELGLSGRHRIVSDFSVAVTTKDFFNLFSN